MIGTSRDNETALSGCSVGYLAVDRTAKKVTRDSYRVITAAHCPAQAEVNLGDGVKADLKLAKDRRDAGWDIQSMKIRVAGSATPSTKLQITPHYRFGGTAKKGWDRPPDTGPGSGRWGAFTGTKGFALDPHGSLVPSGEDGNPIPPAEPIIGMKLCSLGASSWENAESRVKSDNVIASYYGGKPGRQTGRHCGIVVGSGSHTIPTDVWVWIGTNEKGGSVYAVTEKHFPLNDVLEVVRSFGSATLSGDSGTAVWLDTLNPVTNTYEWDSAQLVGILNAGGTLDCTPEDDKNICDDREDEFRWNLAKVYYDRILRSAPGSLDPRLISDPALRDPTRAMHVDYVTPASVIDRQLKVRPIRTVHTITFKGTSR
jgi:hypothetical protein